MSDIKKESIHLYIIQFANYIVPLISLPYLTKTLTLSGMGKLGLAQALFGIIQGVIDFGFTYTASRNVSINLDNKKEVRIIYTNVQFLRLLIFLLILFIGSIVIIFSEFSTEDKILYFISLLSTFSVVLMPLWIFNGISKNSVISRYLILFKFITLFLLFIFVHNPNDYIYAFIILNSLMVFLGFPIFYYLRKNNIYYNINSLNLNLMQNYFKKGFDVFVGTFFSMSYTNFIPFFLKYFTSDYWVGVYTVVERLMYILRQMYVPVIQASYAKLCLYVEKNMFSEYKLIIKRIVVFFMAISIIALIGNILAGKYVIYFLLNNEQIAYKYTFMSMFVSFVVAISMILTYCYYLARDMGYVLKWIYMVATLIFYLVLVAGVTYDQISLTYIYISIFLVELCIVIMQSVLLFILKKGENCK
ncbi:oligosaccharide flippase family protein [Acinetobacter gerneri]|jgi:PST family polysaccharide transporter|uniref:oligosaccharide flippase family protein n=1 Tax=Acinetobacter gerneri TaxID=202952 RepID=UPI0023F1BA47|nr:oligosaccharide flippase family protein [Acinetobacter gerneri]MCH4244372.1 oligosaccharide flippase family protein [Acinetobacter gerneri]